MACHSLACTTALNDSPENLWDALYFCIVTVKPWTTVLGDQAFMAFYWAVFCALQNITYPNFSWKRQISGQIVDFRCGRSQWTCKKLLAEASLAASGASTARLSSLCSECWSKQILNNILIVRRNGDLTNLPVMRFFQEYTILHCHQFIYFHFSQILPACNPTAVWKCNWQICNASNFFPWKSRHFIYRAFCFL